MGRTHTAIGKEFAVLVPPKAAAKANADFAHAEVVLGKLNEAIAAKLPATRAALLKYIQSLQPPSGGKMLDHAIAELHAAGFRIWEETPGCSRPTPMARGSMQLMG
jgi:hypothetical protein